VIKRALLIDFQHFLVALMDDQRDAPSDESVARLRSFSSKIHVQVHGVGLEAMQALANYPSPRDLDALVANAPVLNRQTSTDGSGWKVVVLN
jgi:hypothetical protein